MSKDKLTDYSATNGSNTDVGGINIDEGMLPSAVNNSIRELMTHQKEAFGSGTPLYVDQTNNRVGVGTASPSTDLDITGSGGQVTVDANGHITSKQSLDAATAGGRIIGASNRGTVSQIDLAQTTSSADGGYIRFLTCDSGSTNPTERMRLLSGGGLTFNGDTAAANALDDYEEGNFTVTVSSGISVSSYDHQLGHYVKIGRQVTAWVFAEWNGSSRTGAHFIIDGLPFDSSDSTGDEATFGGFITYQNGFSGDYNIPHVPRGVNEIRFYQRDGSTLIGSELSGASGEVRVVVQYTVP